MRILAIETSCDETAAAVVEDLQLRASRLRSKQNQARFRILSNVVSSQVKIHAPFGGVVPNLAKREHQKNLVPVFLETLGKAKLLNSNSEIRISKLVQNSKFKILHSILEREPELLNQVVKRVLSLKPPPIDAIAVTIGPGLAPALWVGVNFARALAYVWNKPLIPVNHMEAHLYSNFYGPRRTFRYPIVCLTVSGGHTQLILMTSLKRYRVLGETRDDAAGEAFDKGARLLGLAYPGGPKLAGLARNGDPYTFAFPRPMLKDKSYDFSFAGLKTSLLYLLKDDPKLLGRKADLAASYEAAIVDVLTAKTLRAAREFRAKTIFIAGGVAANKKLRSQTIQRTASLIPKPHVYAPEDNLSTDNAVMIAIAAFVATSRLPATDNWKDVAANANLQLSEIAIS
ncbi:tRNA (adenosine(37)-N6)-threonylcarbamoyltransferase complex transferase subunit TsaD [Candidatus Parcubacteria bacterium]|nr:tRNA (adenosine(37)-N6)-threonylcarbamoyltransferase complex transferase subunit TsaD [Candidatus Parcubacteria bacterium]